MKARSPAVCPVCGEDVPPNSPACPECGSDERTGWNDDSAYLDGLDLPDEDSKDSYEEFLEREFGDQSRKRKISTIVVILLLVILAAYFLRF